MLNIIQKLNQNPVYLREVLLDGRRKKKRWQFDASHWIIYLILLAAPVSIASLHFIDGFNYYLQGMRFADLKGFFGFSLVIQLLYCILIGLRSFSLFARDKETRIFPQIISTQMTPEEITLGKFWFTFYPKAKMFTIFLPLVLFIGALIKANLFVLLLFYIYSLFFLAFSSMLGLFFSINSKNTGEAQSRMTIGIVLLSIGSFLLMIFLAYIRMAIFNFANSSSPGYFIFNILYLLNPISLTIELFTMLVTNTFGHSIGSSGNIAASQLILIYLPLYYSIILLLFKKITQKLAEVPSSETENKRKKIKNENKLNAKKDWFGNIEVRLLKILFKYLNYNPVFIKDLTIISRISTQNDKSSKMKKVWQTIIYVFFIPYSVMMFLQIFNGKTFSIKNIYLRFMIIGFLAWLSTGANNSGYFMSFEKLTNNYGNLISTLLKPEEIFWGKFWMGLYPVIRSFIFYSPFIIIAGLFTGFTIPGLLALFSFFLAYSAMISALSLNVVSSKRQKKKFQLISCETSVYVFASLLYLSNIFSEKLDIFFGIGKLFNHQAKPINPVKYLGFSQAKGFSTNLNPYLWLSVFIFVVTFLILFSILFKYMKNKTIEKIDEIPGV